MSSALPLSPDALVNANLLADGRCLRVCPRWVRPHLSWYGTGKNSSLSFVLQVSDFSLCFWLQSLLRNHLCKQRCYFSWSWVSTGADRAKGGMLRGNAFLWTVAPQGLSKILIFTFLEFLGLWNQNTPSPVNVAPVQGYWLAKGVSPLQKVLLICVGFLNFRFAVLQKMQIESDQCNATKSLNSSQNPSMGQGWKGHL